MPIKDLTGRKFGEVTVLEDDGSRNARGRVMWKCQCSCGRVYHTTGSELQKAKSCGCLKGADKAYMAKIADYDSLKTTKPTAKSSTGVRGVYKQKKRYVAYINIDKKTTKLGSFETLEAAAKARRDAEIRYGYK